MRRTRRAESSACSRSRDWKRTWSDFFACRGVAGDGRAEEVFVDEARREERLDLFDGEVGVGAVGQVKRESPAKENVSD